MAPEPHTHPGHATPEGTRGYATRIPGLAPDHFSPAQGLRLSSVGIGTYLGNPDEATQKRYQEALRRAAALGANHIDTAINYRFQQSERAIGAALEEMLHAKELRRNEVFIATKGGYIPFDGKPPRDPWEYLLKDIIRPGLAREEDIVAGCHCLAPSYIEGMLQMSLRNLRLDTIDLYYLHNPEQQLDEISREEFNQRLRAAFQLLEKKVAEGAIRFYGTATWNGYRVGPEDPGHLSLPEVIALAREAGGEDHHLRFLQAPYNLAMPELLLAPTQMLDGKRVPLLEAARRLGIHVVCSASLMQSRLARGLPGAVAGALPGLQSDAQRALQFVRSTPGVTTALVGMAQAGHVEHNLGVARVAKSSGAGLRALYPEREG